MSAMRLPRYSLPPSNDTASANLSILVGAFSHRPHLRSLARQSWGAALMRPHEVLWFIVSVGNQSTADRGAVRREAVAHGDMLLVHGRAEAYWSLPYTSLTFYAAAARSVSCRLVLKTDDDVYVSVPTLRRLLPLILPTGIYAGYVYGRIRPTRDAQSKYADGIFAPQHAARLPHATQRTAAGESDLMYPPFVDGIGELLSFDVVRCIASRLAQYEVPSTLADVVTGHAASTLCGVQPCGGRTGGCLPLPASERAAWPLLPSGEFTLFVRHTDKAIVVEPYRGRLRFKLVPNRRARRRRR